MQADRGVFALILAEWARMDECQRMHVLELVRAFADRVSPGGRREQEIKHRPGTGPLSPLRE